MSGGKVGRSSLADTIPCESLIHPESGTRPRDNVLKPDELNIGRPPDPRWMGGKLVLQLASHGRRACSASGMRLPLEVHGTGVQHLHVHCNCEFHNKCCKSTKTSARTGQPELSPTKTIPTTTAFHQWTAEAVPVRSLHRAVLPTIWNEEIKRPPPCHAPTKPLKHQAPEPPSPKSPAPAPPLQEPPF